MSEHEGRDEVGWVPRWERGVRMRYDGVRERWAVLAPERVIFPDGVALSIFRSVDGARGVGAIAAALCEEYAGPEEAIREDVEEFLETMKLQGLLR